MSPQDNNRCSHVNDEQDKQGKDDDNSDSLRNHMK